MTTNNAWNSSSVAQESKGGTNQSEYDKGDLLYASAVNVLSRLTIGDPSQVLNVATDLPAWKTTSPGSGSLMRAKVSLSNAQVKAMNSSPPIIVSAQGAGTIIIPFLFIVSTQAASETYSGGSDFFAVYANETSNRMNNEYNQSILTTHGTSARWAVRGADKESNTPWTVSNAENVNLVLRSSSDFTGNASNDGTMDVITFYEVV